VPDAALNREPIPQLDFIDRIVEAELSKNRGRVSELAQSIAEASGQAGDAGGADKASLALEDIEDFALGYYQNNVKLFVFGQAHKALL